MKKPNILFILADDMGSWSMGCAGDTDAKTPCLDALASEGIRFESMFCTSPVCSPARASIMTGQMPSKHGVHDWLAKGHINYGDICEADRAKLEQKDSGWMYEWPRAQLMHDSACRYIEGFPTYTDMLAENGYTCALSGKWHLGDAGHRQNGFGFWKTTAMGGENYFYPMMLEGDGSFHMQDGVYITDYITDNAIGFLNEYSEDKPFYLSVHYTSPHAPWSKEQHQPEFYDQFEGTDFPATPNVPPHPWTWSYTEEKRKENLRGYYAAVMAMDAGIGRIIDTLKAKGVYEDTLIIFTADNGMSMGHHGIFGKGNGTFPMNMYDTAVKIPFIASWKNACPTGGRIAQGLYSHYDILPTIAELLCKTPPSGLPGQSFLSILTSGSEDASRSEIVVMDEYGPVRMIRTATHKYVHRYPYGVHELYDLTADPDEETNLMETSKDDPAVIALAANMRRRMEDWFVKYSDPALDGKALEVTGSGQNRRVTDIADTYPTFVPR